MVLRKDCRPAAAIDGEPRLTIQLPQWMQPRPPTLAALKDTIGQLSHLPTLPEAATRAMAVARDPKSSSAQLAAVIERDPAIAAAVLKRANSAVQGATCRIESVRRAVSQLGMKECQNLILAVGLRSMYRKAPAAQRERFERLWQHSWLTACVCRHLGRALALGYQGEEFACGLAHDIGRLLLGLAAPEQAQSADPMDFVEGSVALLRERLVLGTDHCAFGAWFATENNLPAGLVSSIAFHHTPEKAETDQPLVALVAAADHLTNHYQLGDRGDDYALASNPGWPLLVPEPAARGKSFATIAATVLADATKEAEEEVSAAA
jgi:HD-like signal output (HDOD) protein